MLERAKCQRHGRQALASQAASLYCRRIESSAWWIISLLLFFKKRRLLGYVAKSLPTLQDRIRSLTPVERGATLALANAVLLAVGHDRSVDLARSPHRVPQDQAVDIGFMIVEQHQKVLGSLDAMGESIPEAVIRQAIRQVLAFEIVLVTLATSIDPSLVQQIIPVWKRLCEGAIATQGAVEALLAFFKETGTLPLPLVGGRKWTSGQLRTLVGASPPFMGAGRRKAS